MTINGTGFAGGQPFYFSGYPNPGTVPQGNSATSIQFPLNGQMRPRFVNVYGTQADGTGKSNTVPFATIGNVRIAAGCSDYVFADSQGPELSAALTGRTEHLRTSASQHTTEELRLIVPPLAQQTIRTLTKEPALCGLAKTSLAVPWEMATP